MIIRWYIFIRQPKRLVSFRKWLFNKWVSNKYYSSKISKPLGKNVALNTNSYLWRIFFGSADLYFSRNYGLDYSFGYFTFTDPSVIANENFGKFFSLTVKKNIAFLFKLCSISTIRNFWSSSIVYNLNNFLYSSRKKRFLFNKRFFKNYFSKNFFMRKLWYGRFSALNIYKTRKIKSFSWFKEDFLYSKFNFRFLKYLFYVRLSKNLVAGRSSILSHLHLNILSSTFAPKFQNKNTLYNNSKSTYNLIKLQRKTFIPSLFGGWAAKTFVYTPKKVNKDILKIFYLIRRYGYPFLNRYKLRYFRRILRRKQGKFFNKNNLFLLKRNNIKIKNKLKNVQIKYRKRIKRSSNLALRSISVTQWTKFLSLYSSYLTLGDKSLSFMNFKNIPFLKIFSKMSNKFIQGSPILPRNVSLMDSNINKYWSWSKGIAKKDLFLTKILNKKIYKNIKFIILKILRKFLIINLNILKKSHYKSIIDGADFINLFSKKFYRFFKKSKFIFIFKKSTFIKEVKRFYFSFFKDFRSNLLTGRVFYLKKKFKKVLNINGYLFKNLWFLISKKKLYVFFKSLRNNLLNYSLVNISLKQNLIINLYFNIFYNQNLFTWFYFLQSSFLNKNIFIKKNFKNNIAVFYKLVNKNKLILFR